MQIETSQIETQIKMQQFLLFTVTIKEINELVYATVILEMRGYKIKRNNNAIRQCKMRLENTIRTQRSQLIELQKDAKNKNKTGMLRKNKGYTPSKAIEGTKQRLIALATRFRMHNREAWDKKLNALFSKKLQDIFFNVLEEDNEGEWTDEI